MTNVSALPKCDIVSDANLARAARSAIGDFPLSVTGKSLKRHLRNKHHDLVVYLGDRRVKNLATSAALAKFDRKTP